MWVELEDQENAVPEIEDGRLGAPDYADAQLQEALCFEIEAVRTLVECAELRTFEDIAIALDIILEYEVRLSPMRGDRVLLHRLIDALARLAPSVTMRSPGRMEDRKRTS
jgi:hypothetical protein